MNRISLFSTVALLALVGCGAKKEVPAETAAPTTPPAPTATASPFKPNENGQVTYLQAKFWDAANPQLDSIAAIYADSINNKDKALSDAAQVNYTSARESACKTSGISGGYEEYQWIAKNISNPINKPQLDSANLTSL